MKKQSLFSLFFLFVASGFCGLLYQIIWIRLAFAAFGVITPVLSVVISVFMAGLAIGSWAGGCWIDDLVRRSRIPAIGLYGMAEIIIGVGGLSVPVVFATGERFLLSFGSMESIPYLAASAGILSFSILPWCIFMGVTFPFMMAHIHAVAPAQHTSFSFLYLANVIGAMIGTLLTALVLIEWIGLRNCLAVAAACNFGIAAAALIMAKEAPRNIAVSGTVSAAAGISSLAPDAGNRLIPGILFMTGFTTMAIEVVWTRLFTPVLQTTIYSFATMLTVYLCTTWVGSLKYRKSLALGRKRNLNVLLGWLALTVLLPLFANDPRLVIPFVVLARTFHFNVPMTVHFIRVLLVLASITPFCMLLGYLLPQLIDEFACGSPRAAGRAYAINIIGCILGPLVAAYLLLPWLGVKYSFIILSLPYVVFVLFFAGSTSGTLKRVNTSFAIPAVALLAVACLFCRTYEDGIFYGPSKIRRDYAATTTAYGSGLNKRLLVNGIGMTVLTPITKFMAHFPLALLNRPQPSVLVICFGMGTTYRSALAWDNTDVTAIELVPGVRDVFDFYFADASKYISHPRGRILIDDGRRYLSRTMKKYDLITIDPPPPIEAAGSSLLYSREFLRTIREHLTEGGMLQHWFPGGEKETTQAVAQSLSKEFPYVKLFRSVAGSGFHFTASMRPISLPAASVLSSRMPDGARRDFLEWNPGCDSTGYLSRLLVNEIKLEDMLPGNPRDEVTDDQPFNEYFLIRRCLNWMKEG